MGEVTSSLERSATGMGGVVQLMRTAVSKSEERNLESRAEYARCIRTLTFDPLPYLTGRGEEGK